MISKIFFICLANIIRAFPRIRGKVRFGLWVYKKLNLGDSDFVIEATLFPERQRFSLNLNCAHERMAYLMGEYEDDTVDLLTKLYEGGGVLDIGANIGLIALPFAQRIANNIETSTLSKPHVYAIEALQSNYKSLCKNIDLNNLGARVQAINIGLGAEQREVFIQIEGDSANRTGTANILPSDFKFVKIPLQLFTIDQLVSTGGLPSDITLIKIDTDGYDFEIIKGARNLLTKQRPVIFGEFNTHCMSWHGQSIAQVNEYLVPLNYRLFVVRHRRPIRFVQYDSAAPFYSDCLLVPSERVDRLPKLLVSG